MLWLAAIALWAWFAAGWYWRLTAPSPAAAPNLVATDPTVAARETVARHLFGEVVVEAQAVAVSRYTLVGVAAHSKKSPGWAVIAEEGKPGQGFVVGEEIAPGVKLVSVMPDSVEIERGGTRERIPLSDAPRPTAGTAGAPAPNPAPPPQLHYQVNQTGGQPPGFQPSRGAPGATGDVPPPVQPSATDNQPTQ